MTDLENDGPSSRGWKMAHLIRVLSRNHINNVIQTSNVVMFYVFVRQWIFFFFLFICLIACVRRRTHGLWLSLAYVRNTNNIVLHFRTTRFLCTLCQWIYDGSWRAFNVFSCRDIGVGCALRGAITRRKCNIHVEWSHNKACFTLNFSCTKRVTLYIPFDVAEVVTIEDMGKFVKKVQNLASIFDFLRVLVQKLWNKCKLKCALKALMTDLYNY